MIAGINPALVAPVLLLFVLSTAFIYGLSWCIKWAVIHRFTTNEANGFMVPVLLSGVFSITGFVWFMPFHLWPVLGLTLSTGMILGFKFLAYLRSEAAQKAERDIFA